MDIELDMVKTKDIKAQSIAESNPVDILAVDDNINNLKLLYSMLTGHGYKVRFATNGEMALLSVASVIPDLILLDIAMPEMDGYEVCEQIKSSQLTKDIPIIFLSALKEEFDIVHGFKLGANDFVTKPFEAEVLLARVNTHLTINRLQKDLRSINENLEVMVDTRTLELQQANVLLKSKIAVHEQMARQLQTEQDYSSNLISKMPVIICGLTPDGTCTFINPAGEQITGYDKDEILDENWWEIFYPGVESQALEQLNRDFHKVSVHDFDMALTTKNGGKRVIAWSSLNRLDKSGNLSEVIGFGHDVTARKQAEKELSQLRNYLSNIIDSMPSVLVGVDATGKITQWNKTAAESTGIAASTAFGKPLSDVLPRMESEMEKIFESIRTRETKHERKKTPISENNVCYEDLTIYPLIASGAEGAVIRLDDVTDKVLTEEMMIQNEKMLSVGGLAAGMAHEINNPLAGIMQTTNVMANRLTDNEIRANKRTAQELGISMENIEAYMEKRGIFSMITNISTSGQRVASIVDNMLSFARKGDDQKKPHIFAELIDKTLELVATDYNLEKHYDFKLIEIKREYQDEIPSVLCEGAKIQQVLINILCNGAQAMHGMGTKKPLFIIRMRFDKSRNAVRLEIEDNGPGMNEETRKHVFEPFYTTKPKGVGTGLGLSVSYFIITEDHGGELAVESHPGFGAKFIIYLPLEEGSVRINS